MHLHLIEKTEAADQCWASFFSVCLLGVSVSRIMQNVGLHFIRELSVIFCDRKISFYRHLYGSL